MTKVGHRQHGSATRAAQAQVASKADELRARNGLVFKGAFDNKRLTDKIAFHCGEYRERVYGPGETLFAFMSQSISSDRSCEEAVARVNADRIAAGQSPASSDTGAYCRARERLPEPIIQELTTETGQEMEEQVPVKWLWKGRHAKLVDGSTLTMADTPENQAAYPQSSSQAKGCGFPITRLVAIFSLVTGCLLEMAHGAYRGKQTGEHALLRQILHCFQAGDVAVGDAYYAAFFLFALLRAMGVDAVFAAHGSRKADFRAGVRLGKGDHVVSWKKPAKPGWMDDETYCELPKTLEIRECRVSVQIPGFRTKQVALATTMLKPSTVTKEELAHLYARRWTAELNLRSLKTSLQLEHLRGKTPAMVRKEIWTTMLAYNMIRKLIGEAAYRYDKTPTQISFKGAVQHLNAYRSLWMHARHLDSQLVLDHLLFAIARIEVGNRPHRIEPRAVKRRPKPFPRLKTTRKQARMNLLLN